MNRRQLARPRLPYPGLPLGQEDEEDGEALTSVEPPSGMSDDSDIDYETFGEQLLNGTMFDEFDRTMDDDTPMEMEESAASTFASSTFASSAFISTTENTMNATQASFLEDLDDESFDQTLSPTQEPSTSTSLPSRGRKLDRSICENVPMEMSFTHHQERGIELLRVAFENNDTSEMLKLLRGGVRVDYPMTDEDWSALMLAANYGNLMLMSFLLKHRADVNYRACGRGDDLTALMVVSFGPKDSEASAVECAKLLIQQGADVNLGDINGLTALTHATNKNKLLLLKILLDANADVNIQTADGRSALDYAASLGFGPIVRALLEYGADATLMNNDGLNAAEVANQHMHNVICDILHDVISTNWRPGLSPALLDELSTADRTTIDIYNRAAATLEYNERSQIEMVLDNLQLQQYYQKFMEHNMTYLHFLNMTEGHLIDIGIDDSTDRKKIMDAIQEIHTRGWTEASVTPIYLKSSITASEVVCILNNTNKHMNYISNAIKYLNKKAKSNPEMLEVGTEQYPLNNLVGLSGTSLEAMHDLNKELKSFQRCLRQIEKEVGRRGGHGSKFSGKLMWLGVIGALGGVGLALALRHR